jgi:hypothetical protein
MVGIRVNRLELDEAWSSVRKKQKNVLRHEIPVKGDQYVFIGMAGTQKAIIGWRVGKRNADTTLERGQYRPPGTGLFRPLVAGFENRSGLICLCDPRHCEPRHCPA